MRTISLTSDAIIFLSKLVCSFLLFIIMYYSVQVMSFSMTINYDRINDYNAVVKRLEMVRQEKESDSKANAIKDLQGQITEKFNQTMFGNDDASKKCVHSNIFVDDINCYIGRSSENNNVNIAILSGVLTACVIYIYLQQQKNFFDPKFVFLLSDVVEVVFCNLYGAALGLLSLVFIRGVKGAVSSPISSFVEVESPYGIAAAAVLFTLFGKDIFLLIQKKLFSS
jgi:hypothetical protein